MISQSETETFELARQLAASMKTPAHILLHGDLGAGKTAFARGLAAGFGLSNPEEVSSPTFTLINEYSGQVKIFHIDLYRIEPGGLDGLGIDEIFANAEAAVIVEWAERLKDFKVPGAVRVFLEYVDEGKRRIEIVSPPHRGE
jgi:tRNA threonylcarbamoyladenosine biosynthesis protein TsaE